MRRAGWLISLLLVAVAASAIDAQAPLPDPVQQTRYERLARELRCLVCQNETIADSSAPLAADLRRELRRMIVAGQTDAQVREFLTARYGDFVLYRPPVSSRTWLLWAAPGVLLLLALGFSGLIIARKARAARQNAQLLDLDEDQA
jgi:cytochrome c-type biogenesis protein CcmH